MTLKSLPWCAVLALAASLIAGCDRYRITLNEQTLSEPLPLFSDFQVADAALRTCLQQAIIDQGIRHKEDLQTLSCSHGGIASLEGIEVFSGLRTLNLGNNQILGIAPLLFLGNLKALNLVDNPKLDCDQANKLKAQLPDSSALALPQHCIEPR